MTLAVGDKLGPYEILGLLGSGGMGEVYRAHDDRLRRHVAIKVSNAEFTERFTQEARAIASLNHTNICHLYDVGPNYLVMELVEGEVLKGPLDFDDALPIVLQLIDGIEAAHERNIIHRDLKPANIKITPDGVVKILDFGLAKALDVTSSSDANPDNSPTLTAGATVVGAILGTAAYMSPEQARGKTADKRSDIWSFGVIVHEILTGTRPFQGESIVEILGSVLNKDPDLSKAPARAQRLLRWCLERDRKLRLQAIGDARWLLTDAAPMDAVASAATPSSGLLKWAPGITAAAAIAVAAFSFARPVPDSVADVTRFTVSVPQGHALPGRFDSGTAAVSPDGRSMVLVVQSGSGTTAQRALWLRAVDSFAAQKLDNTEGGLQPFWSPDSKQIAFFADGKLKRMPATGGVPLVVGSAPQPGGGTWFRAPGDPEGVILFGTSAVGGTINRVAASGNGLPEAVTRSEKGERHTFPQVLPDGLRFLYLEDGSDRPATYVQKFGDIDQRTLLAEGPSLATFAPPNYLLTQRDGILLAQPWDWDQFKSKGEPIPIADGMPNARRAFSVSTSGTMAYRKDIAGAVHQYRWFKRDGTPDGPALALPEGEWGDVDLSLDNRRAVVARTTGVVSGDLYLVEFPSAVVSRLTSDGRQKVRLAWSPDSRRIVYATRGSNEIQQMVVGSGKSTLVHTAAGGAGHLAWLKDGILIGGRSALELLPTPEENATTPITAQPRALTDRPGGPHRVSPDGKWVAYVTSVEGVWELWVAAFPSFTDQRKITSGAVGPRWRGDAKELIFVSEDRGLMSVDVKPGPSFEFTPPKPLFNPDDAQINGPSNYAVTSDGQRFLMRVSAPASTTGEQIYVVLNWPKLLAK
jgi:Tol biopolymer transport system component